MLSQAKKAFFGSVICICSSLAIADPLPQRATRSEELHQWARAHDKILDPAQNEQSRLFELTVMEADALAIIRNLFGAGAKDQRDLMHGLGLKMSDILRTIRSPESFGYYSWYNEYNDGYYRLVPTMQSASGGASSEIDLRNALAVLVAAIDVAIKDPAKARILKETRISLLNPWDWLANTLGLSSQSPALSKGLIQDFLDATGARMLQGRLVFASDVVEITARGYWSGETTTKRVLETHAKSVHMLKKLKGFEGFSQLVGLLRERGPKILPSDCRKLLTKGVF